MVHDIIVELNSSACKMLKRYEKKKPNSLFCLEGFIIQMLGISIMHNIYNNKKNHWMKEKVIYALCILRLCITNHVSVIWSNNKINIACWAANQKIYTKSTNRNWVRLKEPSSV